jgi:hypothetical protein
MNRPGQIPAVPDGRQHVLAVSADGGVWTWGDNFYGQLGDGSLTPRSTPARLTTLPPIAHVGAGGEHSLAVTADGRVFTWGRNNQHQLGDWATASRSAPTQISQPGFLWMVAAPLADHPSGTYTLAFALSLASATPGATVHYTMQEAVNGQGEEPTEGSPVVTGPLSIDRTLTVKARAYRADLEPSALVVLSFRLPGDADGDGLADADELEIGSDPHNPDTNGDGIPDGAAYAAGLSVTDPDMDHDGLTNVQERLLGTDPFNPDTDGDGVPDGIDCYPLDRTRSACVPGNPDDHTPPDILLTEPATAVLVSTNP